MRWQIEGAYGWDDVTDELEWEVDYTFDNPNEANKKYEELLEVAGKGVYWRLMFVDSTVMKKNY